MERLRKLRPANCNKEGSKDEQSGSDWTTSPTRPLTGPYRLMSTNLFIPDECFHAIYVGLDVVEASFFFDNFEHRNPWQ